MSFKAAAYRKGTKDALNAYGVQEQQAVPENGAEWFGQALRADDAGDTRKPEPPRHRKLERPTRWGDRTSLEGGSFSGNAGIGAGFYGGV